MRATASGRRGRRATTAAARRCWRPSAPAEPADPVLRGPCEDPPAGARHLRCRPAIRRRRYAALRRAPWPTISEVAPARERRSSGLPPPPAPRRASLHGPRRTSASPSHDMADDDQRSGPERGPTPPSSSEAYKPRSTTPPGRARGRRRPNVTELLRHPAEVAPRNGTHPDAPRIEARTWHSEADYPNSARRRSPRRPPRARCAPRSRTVCATPAPASPRC